MNFQMFKLVLEKAEEPEIKLPTSAGSFEKQESSRKTSNSVSLCQTFNCVDHNKLENSSRYGNTRPHDLSPEKSACQEGTVRTGHGTTDWVKIGKGECQGCILPPCLFNFYAEDIMRNVRLDEAQAGIKTARRNINNLKYADDTTLMAESEEELKSLLMKVKEESE